MPFLLGDYKFVSTFMQTSLLRNGETVIEAEKKKLQFRGKASEMALKKPALLCVG